MPESYGKRQRGQVKARKANAREERRLARNQRRADREAGAGRASGGPPVDAAQQEGVTDASTDVLEPDSDRERPDQTA
jgi:hypothetical protein